MPAASVRPFLLPWVLALLPNGACSTRPPVAPEPAPTNGTLTFRVHRGEKTLARPVTACLVVAKPHQQPLQNGAERGGALDGRAEFGVGTRAEDVVAHYAALLTRNGWVAGEDFVAAGNALHFYGITELAGGCVDPQLGVYGATDSDLAPYRNVVPKPK